MLDLRKKAERERKCVNQTASISVPEWDTKRKKKCMLLLVGITARATTWFHDSKSQAETLFLI